MHTMLAVLMIAVLGVSVLSLGAVAGRTEAHAHAHAERTRSRNSPRSNDADVLSNKEKIIAGLSRPRNQSYDSAAEATTIASESHQAVRTQDEMVSHKLGR